MGGLNGLRRAIVCEMKNDPSTSYRAKFANMQPMRHDPSPEKSELLAHIAKLLACDLGKAERVFNFMRRPARGIIVYSPTTHRWSGERAINVQDELRRLRLRITELESAFETLRSRLNTERVARLEGVES